MSEKPVSPLDKLRELADKDLTIDKSQLDVESIRTPKLHNKWLRLLYEKKEELLALEQKKTVVEKDTWLYYNGKADDDVYKKKGVFGLKVMKGDLSRFIESDTEIHKIQFLIERKKSEMEFIQKTIEEINRRTFHVNNTIKFLQFINGING